MISRRSRSPLFKLRLQNLAASPYSIHSTAERLDSPQMHRKEKGVRGRQIAIAIVDDEQIARATRPIKTAKFKATFITRVPAGM